MGWDWIGLDGIGTERNGTQWCDRIVRGNFDYLFGVRINHYQYYSIVVVVVMVMVMVLPFYLGSCVCLDGR